MGIIERLKEPIDYRVGAVLIALVLVVMIIPYRGWAFASALRWIDFKVLSLIFGEDYVVGPTAAATGPGYWGAVKAGGPTVTIALAFFIFGSFVAARFCGEFGIKVDKDTLPESIIGGLLMGIGIVIISTCNIGTFLNSFPQLGVGAWLTAIGLIIGTYIGSKIYEKRMG